jgi:hypothetical protein
MFKKQDISNEIANSMESALVSNEIEKRAENLSKYAKAMDYLNVVAELFDDLGLRKEAEATTLLMEVVAGKKKSKPKAKSKSKTKKKKTTDPAIKGLTPEKMVENLKHKGWVFNADDGKHSSGCMCSMCMDVNDFRHGDDCICSFCMDDDDKDPDISGLLGNDAGEPDIEPADSDDKTLRSDDNYAEFMDLLADDRDVDQPEEFELDWQKWKKMRGDDEGTTRKELSRAAKEFLRKHKEDRNDVEIDFEDEDVYPVEHKEKRREIPPPKHRDTLIPSVRPGKPFDHRERSNWDYVSDPDVFRRDTDPTADWDEETIRPPAEKRPSFMR